MKEISTQKIKDFIEQIKNISFKTAINATQNCVRAKCGVVEQVSTSGGKTKVSVSWIENGRSNNKLWRTNIPVVGNIQVSVNDVVWVFYTDDKLTNAFIIYNITKSV